MADHKKGVLVTGATGAIGPWLVAALRRRHVDRTVVASGHITEPQATLRAGGPVTACDVRESSALRRIVERYRIDTIYHLAAVPPALAQRYPRLAWEVNVDGLHNVLEIARDRGDCRVFFPSSIAVFGPGTPKTAPQSARCRPGTVYGMTKLACETLTQQYARERGVDVRGLRYPPIVGGGMPTGGFSDHAVEMFYAAEATGHYQCPVREDTVVPVIYLPDALRAAIALMNTPVRRLNVSTAYNVRGASFSAGALAAQIREHLPGFCCSFAPDGHQALADALPNDVDDRAAQRDWDWSPNCGLREIVADMLEQVSQTSIAPIVDTGAPLAETSAVPR
jgi:nucleoside-diphosphate-sugar epimerase